MPRGHAATAFTAVAFNTSGDGVVASGGLLLVTADWGATWTTPAYVGPGAHAPRSTRWPCWGTHAVAVGDAGEILDQRRLRRHLAAGHVAHSLT